MLRPRTIIADAAMCRGWMRSRSRSSRRRREGRGGRGELSLSLSLALSPATSVAAEQSREEVIRGAAGVDGVVVVMHV